MYAFVFKYTDSYSLKSKNTITTSHLMISIPLNIYYFKFICMLCNLNSCIYEFLVAVFVNTKFKGLYFYFRPICCIYTLLGNFTQIINWYGLVALNSKYCISDLGFKNIELCQKQQKVREVAVMVGELVKMRLWMISGLRSQNRTESVEKMELMNFIYNIINILG